MSQRHSVIVDGRYVANPDHPDHGRVSSAGPTLPREVQLYLRARARVLGVLEPVRAMRRRALEALRRG